MGEVAGVGIAAIRSVSVLRLEVSVERAVSLRNELGVETVVPTSAALRQRCGRLNRCL